MQDSLGHPREIHPPKYLDGVLLPRGQEISDEALLPIRRSRCMAFGTRHLFA